MDHITHDEFAGRLEKNYGTSYQSSIFQGKDCLFSRECVEL